MERNQLLRFAVIVNTLIIGITLLLPAAVLAGEAAANPDQAAGMQTREPGHRIVCLAPSMVEVVYALGAGEQIVGWSQYTDYPPDVTEKEGWVGYLDYAFVSVEDELAKEVAVVSGFSEANTTVIEALEPTLIFSEGEIQQVMTENLQDLGFETYNFAPDSLEDVYDMMLTIGELIGRAEAAEALVASYKAEIDAIRAITEPLPDVGVYIEIAHQVDYGETKYGPYVTGTGTPFDQMIEIAGGRNVFDHLDGDFVEIAFADIVDADPDVILSPMWSDALDFEVTTIREIMMRPGFENIAAVQTSRIHFYDSSLFKRFGPRTVTAIKKLAYLLHPYYFENPADSASPWELGKIDELYPPETPLK